MANLFIKMLEKFCQGTVYVQAKGKAKKGGKKKKAPAKRTKEMSEIDKVRTYIRSRRVEGFILFL